MRRLTARACCTGLLVIALLQLAGCTHLVFQPLAEHIYTPDVVGVDYEDVYLDVEPGIRLHGWKLLADPAVQAKGRILYLHGNGENISTHFANLYWLSLYGYDGYIFDYRGYGKSSGYAELDGAIRDVLAMVDYVTGLQGEGDTVVLGHSLGGALGIYAVANSDSKDEVDALVTIESFSDYRKITRDLLGNSWLTWALQWPLSLTIDNSYSPEEYIAQVSPVPLLVMHSRRDVFIRFDHAMRLFEAARLPKQFIEIDSDHSHIFKDRSNRMLLLEYLDAL